ncbi:hypothetical protein N0V83_010817 [Neocucurbitaria cava]|uniref:Uncharacterized protein n=1 Tax=Neocucurbitaria cava TaxID=798079 RepID=A0A9W9CH73_9PLEO|nr:hypothetical protein N0V83_010817 [Neocucurbitaria cava]
MLNLNIISGRTFLRSVEGHIGLGPAGARPGDQLGAVLGLGTPLLLRPKRGGSFQVVGDCYIPGLNDAKALLGPLPGGWSVQWLAPLNDRRDRLPVLFNSETENLSEEDPRLADLPHDWEEFEREWEYGDARNAKWFKNTKTGRILNSDPRMHPEALKPRGVSVREIELI